jgi:predicted alpha/beta-hydrolase family hydrolase
MEPAAALKIEVGSGVAVSALLRLPPESRALYVLAHGAGAGMTHPFMAAVAEGLAARGIATLRYQFPFMEQASRRPDPPRVAHAAVRAAVATARRMVELPLFIGGKSFGGRMSSQAQAEAPLEGVAGIVFLGFPLHPPKQPASERADHLTQVACPMLFLQGTRDELADLVLINAVVARLGSRATLVTIDDADHAFHVRKRSGSNDQAVMSAMLDATAAWMAASSASTPSA